MWIIRWSPTQLRENIPRRSIIIIFDFDFHFATTKFLKKELDGEGIVHESDEEIKGEYDHETDTSL